MSTVMRVAARLGTVTVAIAATVAVASPAYAVPSPVVWVDGTVLHVHHNDSPSALDLKIIPVSATTWTVDANVVLGVRTGCRWVDSGTAVICSGKIGRVEARLGSGDDRVDLDPGALRPDVTHVLFGGKGNDTLLGGPGPGGLLGGPGKDYLDGRGGDDTLIGDDSAGSLGADVMIGGSGHDIADYLAHPVGIRASLDGVPFDDGGPGEGDTLSADIEELWGTCQDDVLVGNGLDNFIRASGGADQVWGLGGADEVIPDSGCGDADAFWSDYVDGGPGSDTILYRNNTAVDVYIDLDDQLNDDGHIGERDSYIDMENIDSWAAGWLVGNDEPNAIIGGATSSNFIYGIGGNDTLGGGYRDDVLDGGAGNDTLLGDHPERSAPPGGGGADFLFGGADNDYLDAGTNGMHVEGGSGWDTCVATFDVLTCEVVI